MKILVTGAAGFIGSHLSERLANQGHTVIGIDNFNNYYDPAIKRMNADDVKKAGVEIVEVDLAEADLTPLYDGVDAVYHLAAQPGISATTPYADYLRNNIQASYNLLQPARASDTLKLFINIATSSIYGRHATDCEETSPKPTSYYGVTKLAAEQMALAYQREGHLNACSLRLFSVFGERERPEKLFPRLISSMLEDQPFPLYEGSEKHRRSFTYVGDIVDGFIDVLDNYEKCNGEIINIGSDIETTTGRGIEIVEEIMGKKANIELKPKRPGDQLRTHANIDKARKLLNYEPRTTPEEGLKRMVEWYQAKTNA